MSLDWNKREMLRLRGNPSLRIKQIVIVPEWAKVSHPVLIQWSDGNFAAYTKDGLYLDSPSENDVIQIPRSGEGWIIPGISNPRIWDEKSDDSQIKIRWEEIE